MAFPSDEEIEAIQKAVQKKLDELGITIKSGRAYSHYMGNAPSPAMNADETQIPIFVKKYKNLSNQKLLEPQNVQFIVDAYATSDPRKAAIPDQKIQIEEGNGVPRESSFNELSTNIMHVCYLAALEKRMEQINDKPGKESSIQI